ncbi:endonuclease/exonuclease/phosphatase family protein [Chroococcus sp. FPU101]|uniref:endonuclease/exonuclease/phosphatase family protein n=1 Tax=Chroococcus sp. FPU101 TaxID=1974212 RepID=UPI001A8E9472|nr:endonuclease/exonuclease/phosphatase family protein [Chroococcus sp. FPU101]GFE68708.1 Endonuclease/exonuclease/phosphatase [Chroococcus sp. FPU101]
MQLKIISLNIRYDKPDPDDKNWRFRRKAIASLITHYKPDLIGTQEGKAHQLLDLHRMLPNYQSIGRDRTGNDTGERCTIFYNTERLKCLAAGDFSLSETPEIPGSVTHHWKNSYPRMVTWGQFQTLEEDINITHYNTHLDHNSEIARKLGAKLIMERLSELDFKNSYLFLTGDFNSTPDTIERQTFLQPLPNDLFLKDAMSDVEISKQLSFHDFTDKPFLAIDTIYYDGRVTLQEIKVDQGKWDDLFPSDHCPVIGKFLVNNSH